MFAALAVAERAIGRELRHSVDNALDQNWRAALARWRFSYAFCFFCFYVEHISLSFPPGATGSWWKRSGLF